MRGFTTDTFLDGRVNKTLIQCVAFDFIQNPKVQN